MTRFLARRVTFGVIVLWAVTTVVFIMYFWAPHDPAHIARLAQMEALMLELAAEYGGK